MCHGVFGGFAKSSTMGEICNTERHQEVVLERPLFAVYHGNKSISIDLYLLIDLFILIFNSGDPPLTHIMKYKTKTK